MHKHKWQLCWQFAAQRAQEQFHFDCIGNNDAECVTILRCSQSGNIFYTIKNYFANLLHFTSADLQCGRRQITFFFLHLAIQRDSLSVFVVAQQWGQIHDLLQTRSRLYRTSFARFHRCNGIAILSILEEYNVDTLLNHCLDFLHHFVRIVANANIDANLFAMVEELFIQCDFKLQFARAQ